MIEKNKHPDIDPRMAQNLMRLEASARDLEKNNGPFNSVVEALNEIRNNVNLLNTAYEAAGKTPTPEDDSLVALNHDRIFKAIRRKINKMSNISSADQTSLESLAETQMKVEQNIAFRPYTQAQIDIVRDSLGHLNQAANELATAYSQDNAIITSLQDAQNLTQNRVARSGILESGIDIQGLNTINLADSLKHINPALFDKGGDQQRVEGWVSQLALMAGTVSRIGRRGAEQLTTKEEADLEDIGRGVRSLTASYTDNPDALEEIRKLEQIIHEIGHENNVVQLGGSDDPRRKFLRPSRKKEVSNEADFEGNRSMLIGSFMDQIERAEAIGRVISAAPPGERNTRVNDNDREFLRQFHRDLSTYLQRQLLSMQGVKDEQYLEDFEQMGEDYLSWVTFLIDQTASPVQPAEAGSILKTEVAYPYMGEFDLAKRFLLSGEVDAGFSYEQVKNWTKAQIIHGIYLYIVRKANRFFPPYQPFGPLNFLDQKTKVMTYKGDPQEIALEDVIKDLGAQDIEAIRYRIGSIQFFFKAGSDHQYNNRREEAGTLRPFVKANPIEKYYMQGFFATDAAGISLRPKGVPMTHGEMVRFATRAMLLRGVYHKEIGNQKPSPLLHETGNRPKLAKAIQQISELLTEKIVERYNTFDGWDPDEKPNTQKEAEDLARAAASAITIEMVNFGDVHFVRALHDFDASRFDEMNASSYLHWREVQEKTLHRDEHGKVISREGTVSVDLSVLILFESLWLPQLVRYRFRPWYVYREAGKIKLEQREMTYQDALTASNISDFPPISKEKLNQLIAKKKKDGSITEEDLVDDQGRPLLLPKEDPTAVPFDNGFALQSFGDLISEFIPDSPGSLENNILEHVETFEKLLTSFDFDPSKLLIKKKGAGGREITVFNPAEANKISKQLRSSCYYWVNDNRVKTFANEQEYREALQNYAEPRRRPLEPEESYKRRLTRWKAEWRWRGIPLQSVKRDDEGMVMYVDPKDQKTPLPRERGGVPQVSYAEYNVNHLYNFNVKAKLDLMLKNGEITRDYYDYVMNDFKRVKADPEHINDEDQVSEFMRVVMEKAIILKLQAFKKSGGYWTKEHTDAFVEMLSSEEYFANRSGIRNLIFRKRTGLGGVTDIGGVPDIYEGPGGWVKDESLNILKAVFNSFEMYRDEPKEAHKKK